MDHTPHVIVLGAGASGLSLAWKLSANGVKVDILESSHIVGGLAGTIRQDGYSLDFGPHSFFSEDEQILSTVLALFGSPLKPQPRTVKFYFRGNYLDYPLTPTNVLLQMGAWAGLRASMSFLYSKIAIPQATVSAGEDETVEDWAINNFGRYLYESFFKPYTEQFWKVSCHELSSRSIPSHTRMSFLNTLKVLLQQRLRKVDLSLIEREKLPTYYPPSGFGEITEKVAERVEAAGGQIHLSSRATEVHNLPGERVRVTYEQDGQSCGLDGTHVVSTIPLHLFVEMMRPEATSDVLQSIGKLDYRAMVTLGLVTPRQDVLPCSYIYHLDRPYNRITEMNKFSPDTSPAGENLLLLEVCCLRGSAGWNASKEELFDICVPSLAADRIITAGDVTRLLILKAPYAYPIYRKDYAGHLERLLGEVRRRPGMSTLGRTGEFMYMDSDKCMRRAFDFGDRLLEELGIVPASHSAHLTDETANEEGISRRT
jgi:protoporphyrinogen oxidase